MSSDSRHKKELATLPTFIPHSNYHTVTSNSFILKFQDPNFNPDTPYYCPLLITVKLPDEYPKTKPPKLKYSYEQLLPTTSHIPITDWVTESQQKSIRKYIKKQLWQGKAILQELYTYLKQTIECPQDPNMISNHTDEIIVDDPIDENEITQPIDSPWRNKTESGSDSEVFSSLSSLYKVTSLKPLNMNKTIFYTWCIEIPDEYFIDEIIEILYNSTPVSTATRVMYAYRVMVNTINVNSNKIKREDVWSTQCEEDGETNANDVQLNIIKQYDCQTIVVCARHYGGIPLGDERFNIIAKLTKNVLEEAGFKRLDQD